MLADLDVPLYFKSSENHKKSVLETFKFVGNWENMNEIKLKAKHHSMELSSEFLWRSFKRMLSKTTKSTVINDALIQITEWFDNSLDDMYFTAIAIEIGNNSHEILRHFNRWFKRFELIDDKNLNVFLFIIEKYSIVQNKGWEEFLNVKKDIEYQMNICREEKTIVSERLFQFLKKIDHTLDALSSSINLLSLALTEKMEKEDLMDCLACIIDVIRVALDYPIPNLQIGKEAAEVNVSDVNFESENVVESLEIN